MANLSEQCLEAIDYFHCRNDGIPPHQIIAVEWTSQTVFRLFRAPTDFVIEVFISFDESYLRSNVEGDQFLYHYIPFPEADRRHDAMEFIYSQKTVPPIPPQCDQESAYDLQSIAQRARDLMQNARSMDCYRNTVSSKNVPSKYGALIPFQKVLQQNEEEHIPKMSNHIKHFKISPKFGEFTYFEDRRVKVRFTDRTMLELAGHWKSCTIINKLGEEIKDLDCQQPVHQYKHYIKRALEFANWCSLSKVEQVQYQRSQLQIQNDIQRQINYSQRLIESNQITKERDFDRFIGDDMDTGYRDESQEMKDPETVNQEGLIKSIQSQLNDIDKLLGSD